MKITKPTRKITQFILRFEFAFKISKAILEVSIFSILYFVYFPVNHAITSNKTPALISEVERICTNVNVFASSLDPPGA